MPKRQIKMLDAVALLEDLPERKLKPGKVSTVVEILAPAVYKVIRHSAIQETQGLLQGLEPEVVQEVAEGDEFSVLT